jgi:single-strand DNA-binding protein
MLNLTFTGNVGADPSTRKVSVRGEEVTVTSFSVAINNGKNTQGEDLAPTWIKVSVWRKYADIVAQYVKKGDRVTILAENLKSSTWQSESGETRTSLEVTARKVDFSSNRPRNSASEDFPEDTIPF